MRKISCIRPLYLCSPIDSSDVLVHRVAWIEPFSREIPGNHPDPVSIQAVAALDADITASA